MIAEFHPSQSQSHAYEKNVPSINFIRRPPHGSTVPRMIIIKDDSNKPPIPSVPRSKPDHRYTGSSDQKKTTGNNATRDKRLAKPVRLSKRAMSLPTDLQSTRIQTRELFWFLPNKRQRQLGPREFDEGTHYQYPRDEERQAHVSSLCQRLTEREHPSSHQSKGSTPQSDRASSKRNLEPFTCAELDVDVDVDVDEHDCPLLGLDIIESLLED